MRLDRRFLSSSIDSMSDYGIVCLPSSTNPPSLTDDPVPSNPETVFVCPVCHNPHPQCYNIPFAFFRHMDFETVKVGGRILCCSDCGQITNGFTPAESRALRSLFTSQTYSQSKQTSQTAPDSDHDNQLVNRCSLQARLISRSLSRPDPAILDIGCFDGMLLKQLQHCKPQAAALHGFDINPWLSDLFPTGHPYRFWCDSLAAIDRQYDLITLSYAIIVIDDLTTLFTQIKRLLRPDGLLYIHVPDINRNVCGLLMGDQNNFYTPASLSALLNHFGYYSQLIQPDWAPRDVSCLARIGNHSTGKSFVASNITSCLHRLESLANALQACSNHHPLYVLGTTANAAFCDSILGRALTGFVEENPNRLHQSFRSKSVRHPSRLSSGDTILVPYGPTGRPIAERMNRQYLPDCLPITW